ncbi:phosphate ABC transporter permease PstA [Cellulomonas sp. URHD0024]|uniref:phosphate ABC transporter permease PstA n=1 Tax=Cellulomonas sp. URHD0024 TaxID=1302620 RepID=UPI000426B2FF|nr:phosphate ABC transporter permease PstA [Cellulomonas sp. URHD0024]
MTVAPERAVEMEIDTLPRTWLRPSEDRAERATAPIPRPVSRSTAQDLLVGVGSLASALALAWVVCYRLLPWGTVLGYVIVSFVLFLVVLALAFSSTAPGPVVADRVVAAAVTGGALLVGLAIVSAVVFTFVRAAPALPHPNLFTQDMSLTGPRDPLTSGGVLHAIVGTLIQIGIAILITVPLGIGTAVFMTEVGGKFAHVVRTVVDAMTALPSIVAGLFIYTVFIITFGLKPSGLAAALALSVMMLPIIARAADVVLRVFPSGLREAGLALGAPRWRTVWHVVLPTARPGLATALILGVARGVGETSPVLLTSGASTFLTVNPVGTPMNSLPLFVFTAVRSGQPILVQRGFAAAAILLTLVLTLFIVARLVARKKDSR